MADLWVVLTVIGFFVIMAGLVRGCDRIIEHDDIAEPMEHDDTSEPGPESDEAVAGMSR